jgi:large subunit ribosomal protein L21
MYAIIRAGGKQAKVQSGDVIEIERVKGDAEKLSFAPLLVVDDKGNAISDRDTLAKASVTAKVLGGSQGPKVDIFKYKNKTGYSRRQGHRQKYTQIEITEIKLPGASKTKTVADKPAEEKTAAKQGEEKPAAKTAGKQTESKPAAKSATKATEAKPAAKSPAKAETKTTKPAAKAKADTSEEE